MDLKQKIKELPTNPGIYLMKDSLGNIIYVGKAKNLKNRVSQYFQKSKAHAPKILKMIQNIDDFEYIITDTELDAFLKECEYIKDLKPMYNSQMKNDKGYSYIRIGLNEKYPRVSVSSEVSDNKAKYYGPYTSLHKVEGTLAFLKDYYKLRKCTSGTLTKRNSGCLNYELGLCLGVCSHPEKMEDYNQSILKLIEFLELKDDGPMRDLHEKMHAAAEKYEFERAAKYREYIVGLRHILNKQRLIQTSLYDRNIIAIEFFTSSKAKAFFIKGNKMLGSEILDFDTSDRSQMKKNIMESVVINFDGRKLGSVKRLGQKDIDEAQIIYSYLRRNKKSILSFWVPSNWLSKDSSKLEKGLEKLIDRVFLTKGVLYEEGEVNWQGIDS